MHRNTLFKVIGMKRSPATTYYYSFIDMMQLHELQSIAGPHLKVSLLEFKSVDNFTFSFIIMKQR